MGLIVGPNMFLSGDYGAFDLLSELRFNKD